MYDVLMLVNVSELVDPLVVGHVWMKFEKIINYLL